MNEEQKYFPAFPQDGLGLGMLQQFTVLGNQIITSHGPKTYEEMSGQKFSIEFKAGAILAGIGMLPIDDTYLYFLIHEECKKFYTELGEFYNPIINKGQDYALGILDKELGDMQPYFNPFQLAMYHVNMRYKTDESVAPLNIILWCFYMSLYKRERFVKWVNAIFDLIQNYAIAQSAIKE